MFCTVSVPNTTISDQPFAKYLSSVHQAYRTGTNGCVSDQAGALFHFDLQLVDEFLIVGHGGDEAAEEEDAEGAREEHGLRRVGRH